MNRWIAVTLLAFGLAACKVSESSTSSDGHQRPPEMVVNSDPEMTAAIQKARDTVDEFRAALQNPKATFCCFSLKHPFKGGGQVEHMWLTATGYKDGKFVGIIENDPVYIGKPRYGDTVFVDAAEISDWMYFDADVVRGGYSVRLFFDRMSEPEKKSFLAEFPARFE